MESVMRILLTNDDGFDAQGLRTLFEVFSGYHETYVIAPDRERSACSNQFTIRTPITVTRRSEREYSINGYPADCVSIGLNTDLVPDIDLVVSGINHGPNLGDDVFFSGTVGGARTAVIFGRPGIALSMDCYHRTSRYFSDAAEFTIGLIREIEERGTYPYFLNINYPDLPRSGIEGVKYVFTGKRYYRDRYDVVEKGDGIMDLHLSGEIESLYCDGCDMAALRQGYIAVTPLSIDSTDYAYLQNVKTGVTG